MLRVDIYNMSRHNGAKVIIHDFNTKSKNDDSQLIELRPEYSTWQKQLNLYLDQGLANTDLKIQHHLSVFIAQHTDKKVMYHFCKRIFDFLFATCALILMSPLLLIVSLVVKLDSNGPIFFKQLRIGYRGNAFWIFKFRTMYMDTPTFSPGKTPLSTVMAPIHTTRFGQVIRNWKIDELPQLYNVIKGEMSIVGPRPLPVEESACTPAKHYLRFASRPGLTGLWQANHPNTISGELKIKLDADYVRLQSMKLDLSLILKTLSTILKNRKHYK